MTFDERIQRVLEEYAAKISVAVQEKNYGRVFLAVHDMNKIVKKAWRLQEVVKLEEDILKDE